MKTDHKGPIIKWAAQMTMLREPSRSCVACGKALLAQEILYTAEAEIICDGCAPPPPMARQLGQTWHHARYLRARTQRRRSLLAAMGFMGTCSALFVAWQVLRAPPMATIDAPEPRALVGSRLSVRGRIAPQTIHRPLWLVARSSLRCPDEPAFPVVRVVAAPDGAWQAMLSLPGPRGRQYFLTLIAADDYRNAKLEAAERDHAALRTPAVDPGGRCHHRSPGDPSKDPDVLASVPVWVGEGEFAAPDPPPCNIHGHSYDRPP